MQPKWCAKSGHESKSAVSMLFVMEHDYNGKDRISFSALSCLLIKLLTLIRCLSFKVILSLNCDLIEVYP